MTRLPELHRYFQVNSHAMRQLSPLWNETIFSIPIELNDFINYPGILQFETMPASGDSKELTFAVMGDLGTYVTITNA